MAPVDETGTSTPSAPGRVGKLLEPWAVDEALRYFEQNLLLEVFRKGERSGDRRAERCAADFRCLIESWRPNCTDFWWRCAEFSKKWGHWGSGAWEKSRTDSPRARPLSAGRLTNYLTRLSLSTAPATLGAGVELCTEAEEYFPPVVFSTAHRFGIRASDIRVTCDSVFEACKDWTGLDWGKDGAADPCPWPVAPDLDGLRCCWRQLAAASGHERVYLNPPWSKLDVWLYKAACEARKGIPVLAVVPSWQTWSNSQTSSSQSWSSSQTTVCKDIKQFSDSLNKEDPESPPRHLDIRSRVLWDAEFAHPTTGSKMPPLNVMLIWLRLNADGVCTRGH